MTRNAALLPLAVLLLGGCSLEPRYERTTPPVTTSWPVGDAYLRRTEATLPTLSYTDIFRDPKLQAVIAQALTNNRDLRIAAGNVASARALYRVERSSLFPQVDATGRVQLGDNGSSGTSNVNTGTGNVGAGTGTGGIGTGTGGTGNGNGGVVTTGGGSGFYDQYSINVGVSAFEVDLFGRIRSQSRAALATYFSTEAAARATRLSLVAEVASAYLTYASDRSQLAIARATEASAARSVTLTRARLQGGIAPRTDLRQAETVLLTARADTATLTTALAQDVNALTLLVGAPVDPALLPASIESVDGLLAEVPAGLNSDILLRRPDVVQSEFDLRATNARIGAARAAFFPTISLTSLAGLASGALGSLFSGGAFNWSASPTVTLPIFDGGANRGNLAYARAQQQVALATYEQTIQTAFREVSDALARRGTIDRELAARRELTAAAQDNYYLTERSYRGGIGTFLNSLDAQRTLYNAQQQLVTTRLTRADNLVTLYRVLGGDAQIAGDPAAAAVMRSPVSEADQTPTR
ncbi:efflux transporter outer membrane subunit [Sphingomonas prati]|uniref:Multidrug efflux system outer membrane protein n=1 Tax=Sphingomonas prati TaxID=1843237 RepID=A0A7W9BTA4_9SPHN|nr:efflux transporter outer membrane subunit [Sphingomonas prati]MBB5729733.1 multidrug efflux system outer membrane protein [Sphingomonas prati]GGE89903.1 multidrug transporter [Sphingomonas prati]